MDPWLERRFEGHRIDRTPTGLIREAGLLRQSTGNLRRNDIGDACIERIARRFDRSALQVDPRDPAGEFDRQPLDHSRIVAVPAVLEQILFKESILRIEDHDLRPRLVLLEIIGYETRALVGAGRTAKRVWR